MRVLVCLVPCFIFVLRFSPSLCPQSSPLPHEAGPDPICQTFPQMGWCLRLLRPHALKIDLERVSLPAGQKKHLNFENELVRLALGRVSP